jgi:hypothetical protein
MRARCWERPPSVRAPPAPPRSRRGTGRRPARWLRRGACSRRRSNKHRRGSPCSARRQRWPRSPAWHYTTRLRRDIRLTSSRCTLGALWPRRQAPAAGPHRMADPHSAAAGSRRRRVPRWISYPALRWRLEPGCPPCSFRRSSRCRGAARSPKTAGRGQGRPRAAQRCTRRRTKKTPSQGQVEFHDARGAACARLREDACAYSSLRRQPRCSKYWQAPPAAPRVASHAAACDAKTNSQVLKGYVHTRNGARFSPRCWSGQRDGLHWERWRRSLWRLPSVHTNATRSARKTVHRTGQLTAGARSVWCINILNY